MGIYARESHFGVSVIDFRGRLCYEQTRVVWACHGRPGAFQYDIQESRTPHPE